MPLRCVIDRLDDVEERLRSHYVEHDGRFVLDIEGSTDLPFIAPLRNAHERVKADTEAARRRLAEVEQKIAQSEELRRLRAELDPVADHKATVNRLRAEIERERSARHRETARAELQEALIAVGVKPQLLAGAIALHAEAVQVGKYAGIEQAIVVTRFGRVPVRRFIERWADTEDGRIFTGRPARAGGEFAALIRALR
jgi:hypothetical protein